MGCGFLLASTCVLIDNRIIRIIFMIPVFAILSFLGVCFMDASIYLTPFEDLFESFALASFFLLMCTFVHEDEDERQAFFQTSGTIANYHVSICICNECYSLTQR